tara:strand:- start:1815 stop:3083 length:1269 start_codon:yes stop_codon:yes gene_type:complete
MITDKKFIEGQLNTSRIKNNILPLLLGVTPLFSIIFDEKWVPYFIGAIVIAYFLEPNKKENVKHNSKLIVPFALMVLVFILFTLVSSNILLSLKVLERQVSLILLPFIVFATNWNNARMIFFLKAFVFALSVFCLYSFGHLIWFYFTSKNWIEIMNLTQDNSTYLLFKFPHLVNTHPTYWSYLLVIANLIVLSDVFYKFFRQQYVVVFLWLIFNTTLILLAARTPLTINIVAHLLLFGIYQKSRKDRAYKIRALLLLFSFIVTGLILVPRISFLSEKFSDALQDERFYLWPIALQQIKENFFVLGEGLGMGSVVLKEYIIEYGDIRQHYNSFDLHNQYLLHYLEMGILGLFALVGLIVYPIVKIRKIIFNPGSFLSIGLVLLVAFACFTESPMYRLRGIIIVSIFYSTFLVSSKMLKSKSCD